MSATVIVGDCRELLRAMEPGTVRCCVTSPPYWGLRDYGVDGQLGLEQTPEEYVAAMVDVFREVRPVLTDDGTLWLNIGDSYANTGSGDVTKVGGKTGEAIRRNRETGNGWIQDSCKREIPSGLKPKDLVGIPWRIAFALQAEGWWLRSDIIWHKPNPMPESVTDRPTKAHEYLFLLAKSQRYYYDADAVREKLATPIHAPGNNVREAMTSGPMDRGGASQWDRDMSETWGNPAGRNKRDVWTIATQSFKGAHFATFPEALVQPCVLAGSAVGDTVLDPFCGSGTTGAVAVGLGRNFVGLELNEAYAAMARRRIGGAQPPLLLDDGAA